MVQHSANDHQAMCRGFSHPLGVQKFTNPLNGLSKLKSQHSRPHLELVDSQSNWSNIEDTTDALQVQTDLNSLNNRNDQVTHVINRPRVKSLHQGWENRLQNSDHKQLTHPSEQALDSEMLKLGEINIFLGKYSSLSKVLFVPLVVLHKTE